MGMMATVAQAVLPAGFRPEHRLGNGDFGEVWSAHESCSAGGPDIPRVIRRIPATAVAEHDFRDALCERVCRLRSLPLPFVSVPTHVERLADGGLAIVEPDLHTSLTRWRSPERKLDPLELERWAEQLLTGLAALHAAKLAHGDVRLGNVFLVNGEGPAERTAWLGDAAVGPLTFWSNCVLMNGDAAAHRPPEWSNQWKEPEPRADLYALGITLWKLLCPESELPKCEPGDERMRQIVRGLGPSGATRAVKRLIPHLLAADPQERLQNAPAALRLFRRLQRHQQRRPWLMASAVAAPLFVLAIIVASMRHSDASRLDVELQSTHKEVANERERSAGLERQLASARESRLALESALKMREDDLTSRNQELVARVEEINDLKRENAELKKIPPPKAVALGVDEQELAARKHWQETIRRGDTPDRQLDLAREGIERPEKDARLVRHLDAWEKEASRLVRDTREWSRADDSLRERVRQFVREPWTTELRSDARKRLEALNAAASQWKLWAETAKLTPEDVEKQLGHEPLRSNEPGRILSRWWADIQPAKHPQWTLRLVRGRSAKPGFGTTRMVGVHGTEWAYTSKHDWDDPQKHEYPDDEASKIRFAWKPGEPAGLCLLGEFRALTVYTTRPYLIQANDLFQGPVALWLMQSWAAEGGIEQGGFVIEYEILDCPGPPPSLLQKLEAAVKGATSSSGGPAQ